MSRAPRLPRGISSITLAEPDPDPAPRPRETTPALPPTFASRAAAADMRLIAPAPLPPARRPSGGGGVVVSFLILLAMAGAGVYWFVLREQEETTAAPVATSEAVLDAGTIAASPATESLPDVVFARPTYASAEWVDTSDAIQVTASVIENQELQFTVSVDYGRRVARVDAGGALEVDGKPQTIVLTPEHLHKPGSFFGQPWTREPRPAGNGLLEVDDLEYLALYQDVVTAEVRASAQNVTAVTEELRDVAVTTYRFDVDVRLLGGQMTRDIDPGGLLDDDAVLGSVRVSIDTAGLVRMYEVRLPVQRVRPLVEAAGDGASVIVELRREVTSVSSEPLELEVPPNTVDIAAP